MTIITGQEKFIRISDKEYPLSLDKIKRKHQNVVFGFPVTSEILLFLGYAPVTLIAKPSGDVVTELPPALINGDFTQVWLNRSFSKEEKFSKLISLKNASYSKLEALVKQKITQGISYDFKDPYGVLTIQIEDKDRANLALALALAENDLFKVISFRVLENIDIYITGYVLKDLVKTTFEGYLKILESRRVLKEAISLATTENEIPELKF